VKARLGVRGRVRELGQSVRLGVRGRVGKKGCHLMSEQAHYFKIGLFVIAATALAVVGIIVLGAGKWFERSMTVETYFYESVQGLEVGAPVRLRGVRVGRVESIKLAREEYGVVFDPKTDSFPYRGLVLVRMSIRPSVAVHLTEDDGAVLMQKAVDSGFRLRLGSQGITGVLYIESEFVDPERYPPIRIVWTPKTPYIPSAPSTITELGVDLRSITRKLEQLDIEKISTDFDVMLTSVTRLVNDVQGQQLGPELKQVMAELRGSVQDARRVLTDADLKHALKDSSAAMADIRRTAVDLSHTAKDMRQAMTLLPEITARLNTSVRRIDALLASKGETIDELLENLRSVTEELHYLTKTVEHYPSQVLFGEPPAHSRAVQR
jgi:phospholipid/cholesterol/gamma-HCH transport system substrate-binding protein/paraquat-inducible protein B